MIPVFLKALENIRPGSKWACQNNVYEGLDWLDTQTKKPSKKEIEDEISRIEEELKLTEYVNKRIAEYPSIGDQLDSLFKAGVFPDEMAAQIQAIKDKYPKGTV